MCLHVNQVPDMQVNKCKCTHFSIATLLIFKWNVSMNWSDKIRHHRCLCEWVLHHLTSWCSVCASSMFNIWNKTTISMQICMLQCNESEQLLNCVRMLLARGAMSNFSNFMVIKQFNNCKKMTHTVCNRFNFGTVHIFKIYQNLDKCFILYNVY